MWNALKEMLASKKAIAMLAGLIAWLVAKIGWDVDTADLIEPLTLVIGYIVGQGIADHGKAAAQVNAAAARELASKGIGTSPPQ